MQKSNYVGVVFDFDGVLYDSERYWEKLEIEFINQHLEGWEHHDYANLTGRPVSEVYDLLCQRGLKLDRELYLAKYEEMAHQIYSDYVRPIPFLKTLLTQLGRCRAQLAIASSSKRSWIERALQGHTLPVTFSTIVSASDPDIERGKPAPDVYLRAAHLLGEPPERLIAIEDSSHGVTSACVAGLYCIGLRNGFNDTQDLSHAHEIMYGYRPDQLSKILSDLL